VKYGVECSQVCIDTPGSVKCGCTDGYKLSADGLSCSPQVACSNTTTCAHNCLKRDGVDTCTCNPGYSLDSADNSTCIDIDECMTNTSLCDKNLGVCENVEGSYTCSCLNDFTVGPNGECEGMETDWAVQLGQKPKESTLYLYNQFIYEILKSCLFLLVLELLLC